jgi:hypothetical protein
VPNLVVLLFRGCGKVVTGALEPVQSYKVSG